MENKDFKKKSIREEKIIRKIDYDSFPARPSRLPKKSLIDIKILRKRSPYHPVSQRILVYIKRRVPSIKTLYIAGKNRLNSKKDAHKTSSPLTIGDHLFSVKGLIGNSIACGTEQRFIRCNANTKSDSPAMDYISSITDEKSYIKHDKNEISTRTCYPNNQCFNLNTKIENPKVEKRENNKVVVSPILVTNALQIKTHSSRCIITDNSNNITDHLQSSNLNPERVIASMDQHQSSSDEKLKYSFMKPKSNADRAGCSYIQQYSHIPETSAFQKYAQQTAPLSMSNAGTLDKEHNSEQYGRDFTAYDGLTARGRRQCASVPCGRDNMPKMAADRVKKMRHKLNPVRDYRLMDTVHYLAQGEFAPRDDGIKLTPSREAVLSDIIWEDVCRTHWPNTRLGRRGGHSERQNIKYELQRQIDSLLKERIAHVERRKRRHYKIVKLSHRHDNYRALGKTGDIIVASHESKQGDKVTIPEDTTRRCKEKSPRRSLKSHDPNESNIRDRCQCQERGHVYEDNRPGPSYCAHASPFTRNPTNCYQTEMENGHKRHIINNNGSQKLPRLLVKKECKYRRCLGNDEPNPKHTILLSTTATQTPSIIKRHKKFNQLYHRILSFHNCRQDSKTMADS